MNKHETEEQRHARRMKNYAYASGYHIGFADGFRQGEENYKEQYDRMVKEGTNNVIDCLMRACNQLDEENKHLRRILKIRERKERKGI